MYEVFSIDLNAMDDYVQSQTGAVDFILNIRTGWSWSLSLEKDTAWASTLFGDNVFEGIAGNIDTNRTTLHISETNLFGYVSNGSNRYRISAVVDILGVGHAQHFVVYETQICTEEPLPTPEPAIKVFPNPASGQLTLTIENPASGEWQLFHADGRLALRQSLQAGRSVYEVDVAALPPGMYFYRVFLEGQPAGSGKVSVVR